MKSIGWERADGWPRLAAGFCLAVSVGCALSGYVWSRSLALKAVPSGWLTMALLSAGLALMLLCWRRTLRIAEGALYQGWGLKVPLGRGLLRVREAAIPLPPLEAVWVEERRDHFKRWASMFAVVAGKPQSLQRLVLDDEFADQPSAERQAHWLANALQLPLVPGITSL